MTPDTLVDIISYICPTLKAILTNPCLQTIRFDDYHFLYIKLYRTLLHTNGENDIFIKFTRTHNLHLYAICRDVANPYLNILAFSVISWHSDGAGSWNIFW